MKRLFSLLLIFIMLFSISTSVFAVEKPITVKLCNYMDTNGKWVSEKTIKFDVDPIVINGRTMVPIRAVAEELGYEVKWSNGGNGRVTISREFVFDKNSKEYYKKYNQMGRNLNMWYNIEGGNNYDGKYSEIYKNWYSETPVNLNETTVGTIEGVCETAGFYAELEIKNKKGYIELHPHTDLGGWFTCKYTMDVAPIIENNRTLLPLRAVGEMLGLDVSWDGKTRTVKISA